MLPKFYSLIPFFLFSQLLNAQIFLNGSFENTTSIGCNYNLNNTAFNSLMSDVNAYGAGNETDIMVVGCFVPSIPDGTYCVALAAPSSDELAMLLSSPLVAGTAYTFTFYAYSDTQFRPQGNVEIGASTNNNTFGSLIYTGITVPNTWVQYTVSFVAPNNTTHITMRNIAGTTHWNRLDDFELVTLLPVQIEAFTAVLKGQKVQLDWQTQQEKDSDYFSIERSLDGLDWEALGQLSAAGNSTNLNSYQFFDEQPYIGVNYYRIKEFDYNGNAMVSNIRVVDYQANQDESIVIYPNPAYDQLTVSCLLPETGLLNIEVYDVTGRKLFALENIPTTKGQHQEQINLNELSPGVYFLQVSGATFRYGLQKIVKQ